MAGTVKVREESTRGGGSVEAILDDMEGAVLINYSTEYALYVEFPTSYTSGPPPFDAIFDWVSRKWGDLSSGLKAEGGGTKEGVAKLVQWSIYHNGTDGVYFATRALEQAVSNAPAVIDSFAGSGDPEANQKILAEIGNKMFAESQKIIANEATDTGNLLQSGSIEFFDSADDLPSGGGEEFSG